MEYLTSTDIILFIQRMASPLLDYFFIAVTWLGNEDFYLIVIPILYWCADKNFAFKLGIVFLASAYVNDFLKPIFATERPAADVVRVLYAESGGGYSFPSGHSQNAVAFWGLPAWELKRAWAWTISIIIMLLIGISRLYLGLHWPIDLLGGWTIGAIILGVYILYDAKIKPIGYIKRVVPQVILIYGTIHRIRPRGEVRQFYTSLCMVVPGPQVGSGALRGLRPQVSNQDAAPRTPHIPPHKIRGDRVMDSAGRPNIL